MILTGSLVSCNKVNEPPKSKRTNVYSTQELPLEDGISYIRYFTYADGKVYLTYDQDYTITRNELGEEIEKRKGYYWEDTLEPEYAEIDEETEAEEDEAFEKSATSTGGGLPEGWYYEYISETNLIVMNLEDGTTKSIALPESDDIGYQRTMVIDSKGIINFIYSQYTYDEVTMTSTSMYTLVRNDANTGELIDSTPLNDIITSAGYDMNNVYLNNLAVSDSGEYYIVLDNSILVLNSDMTVNNKYDIESGWCNDIISNGDSIYMNYYPDNGQNYIKVFDNGQITDFNSENLKEATQNMYSIIGVENDRIYFNTSDGVFYYDFVTDTSEEMLNYINSDLNPNEIDSLILLPDEKLCFVNSQWLEDQSDKNGGYYKTTVNILTRIPDEELQEEIIVTLGSIYQNYRLTQMIVDFNKKNTGVRISLKTYDEYNNESNEYKGASTQLNIDIITGSAPDIIFLDSSLPVDSYFQKGIFVDLNKYVDDPEVGLNRADYLSNIFDACTTDGRLNSIITQFSVQTLVAKSKYVGTESGWTFEDMMETIQNAPDGMDPFFGYSRDSIIDLLLNNAMSSFINWDTGNTEFGTQAFIDFINYLKSCPEKGFWESYYDSDDYVYDYDVVNEMSMTYDMRFYNDSALFYDLNISSFSSMMYAYDDFATNEVTAIGYPDEDGGNGALIVPSMEFAINAQSQVADQAWTFIKYILENNTVTYQFTPSISYIENMASEAKNDYYYNEELDIEWYKNSGYSDEYIEYLKMSNQPYDESSAEQVMSIIKGATHVVRSDEELLNIINEELSGFFGGTKSAEQTATVIANRVGTYVSVNS